MNEIVLVRRDRPLYTLTFHIPWLPPTNASDSRHWRTRFAIARRSQQMVYAATFGQLPAQPLRRAKLILTRYSAREPDYDGLVASFKYVLDALCVKHWAGVSGQGVLVDDKPSNIGHPEYQWRRAKRGKGGLVVLVAEVVDGEQA